MGVCTYGKCMIFQPDIVDLLCLQASGHKNEMFNKNALLPVQQVFVFNLPPSPPFFFPSH